MSKGNVNKIILVGNLGREPELKYTPKGQAVLHISLATNREFKTAEGEAKKETAWHKAVIWGKRGEACAKYLTKGSRIYIEGELRMNKWTDKEGKPRSTPEIHVSDIQFLGGTKPSGMNSDSVEEPVLTLSH
ncbi:MAG TPA: single-stranded DNA-binding protein [Bdellovibrionota bacterium]|jgi:single-strand DNA-binding protein